MLYELAEKRGIDISLITDIEYVPESETGAFVLRHDARYYFYPMYLVSEDNDRIELKTQVGDPYSDASADVTVLLERNGGKWQRKLITPDVTLARPPLLTVTNGLTSAEVYAGAMDWSFGEGGETKELTIDAAHPLDPAVREKLPVISVYPSDKVQGGGKTAYLVFGTTPDEVTVRRRSATDVGNYNAAGAYAELRLLPENAYAAMPDGSYVFAGNAASLAIPQGEYICEVTAKWSRFGNFGGTASYIFRTKSTVPDGAPPAGETAQENASEALNADITDDLSYLTELGVIKLVKNCFIFDNFIQGVYSEFNNSYKEVIQVGDKYYCEMIITSENVSELEDALGEKLILSETGEYYECPFKTLSELENRAKKYLLNDKLENFRSSEFIIEKDGRLYILFAGPNFRDWKIVSAEILDLTDSEIRFSLNLTYKYGLNDSYGANEYTVNKIDGEWVLTAKAW